MNRFLVMTYSPQLKGKAKQYGFNYLGVRVVETTDGQRPNSSRAKNVVRVVEEWGGVPMGQTLRSKGVRVMAEAKALAKKLNDEASADWAWKVTFKDGDGSWGE